MGLLWTPEQKIKVGSKCFANLTGVSGTIATVTSFAVLFTANGLLDSSSLQASLPHTMSFPTNLAVLFNQNLG
jgi:hypothetical protein